MILFHSIKLPSVVQYIGIISTTRRQLQCKIYQALVTYLKDVNKAMKSLKSSRVSRVIDPWRRFPSCENTSFLNLSLKWTSLVLLHWHQSITCLLITYLDWILVCTLIHILLRTLLHSGCPLTIWRKVCNNILCVKTNIF